MKNVLITGGTRGIGRAMVISFAERGYGVAFTYKSSEDEARRLSLATGALAIRADNAIENDVIDAFETVEEKLGNVEILINNAAVSEVGLITDTSYDAWRRVFSVNVDGAFLYTKLALRGMIRRHCGRIINVSSMWGQTGASCEVAYSASKAAIIGMTKALAKEVGTSGITVNCISPGVIDTDMNAAFSDDDMRQLAEQTPLMRIGTPQDVVNAALFLADDASSFITGAVINVNGGFLI